MSGALARLGLLAGLAIAPPALGGAAAAATVDLADASGAPLARAVTASARGRRTVTATSGGVAPTCAEMPAGLRLDLVPARDAVTLALSFASGAEDDWLDQVEALGGALPALAEGPGLAEIFADGRSMGDLPQVATGGDLSGQGVAAIARGGRGIAFGCAGGEAECTVTVKDGRLWARFDFARTRVAAGTCRRLVLVVARGDGVEGALRRWAEVAAGGAEPPRPRTGWCSWYAMANPFQEWIVQQAAAAHRLGLEVAQVDDGWQLQAGEWEPNGRFSAGMASLARDLRGEGMVPGLWLAPFAAALDSPVVREHPDWVMRRADGSPTLREERPAWGGTVVALDPSRPQVRAWLKDLLARVTREWGFAYVKLDFLTWGISPERADKSLSPLGAYRAALEAMREGAAPGTYILGCDAAFAGSVGVVDAVRTGPDAQLDPVKQTVTLTASARRLHWARVFALDPDVVMVRDEIAPAAAQARAWAPLLLGGAFFSGDPLTNIAPARRGLIARAAAELPALAARPRARLERAGSAGPVLYRPGHREAMALGLWLPLAAQGVRAIGPGKLLLDPLAGRAASELRIAAGELRLLGEIAPGRPVAFVPDCPSAVVPVAEQADGALRVGPAPGHGEVRLLRQAAAAPGQTVQLGGDGAEAARVEPLPGPPPAP